MANIISAVFQDRSSAERAVTQLREMGIPDNAISVVGRHGEDIEGNNVATEHHDADTKTSGMAKGIGIGAGVGALFGLAAALIPGVGPFITAGALASVLGSVGGGAAAGAIVGGTTGGIVGVLENYGVSRDEAQYYGGELERGGWFVGVDTSMANVSSVNVDSIRQTLQANGGRSSAYMA
jgi:hypothetical protein